MSKDERKPRFKIGTMFKTRHKHPRVCTVIDIYRTYNSKDEMVSFSYVSSHEFLGQAVLDRDVPESTIAMGLIKESEQ